MTTTDSGQRRSTAKRPRRSLVMLIAEDVSDTRELYAEYFEHRGYRVVTALDGESAVQAALDHAPDVIVMDLAMPQIDGITAIQRIKTRARALRSRVILQRYGPSGWATCRDTGYLYNTGAAFGWVAGVDMGTAADCGSGSYRAIGYGSFYQGGGWRGGGYLTPVAWLP